jgi:hypothetical protein
MVNAPALRQRNLCCEAFSGLLALAVGRKNCSPEGGPLGFREDGPGNDWEILVGWEIDGDDEASAGRAFLQGVEPRLQFGHSWNLGLNHGYSKRGSNRVYSFWNVRGIRVLGQERVCFKFR